MKNNRTYRKSRFHDEKGNRIDLFGLLYLPHAFLGAFFRRFFGYRPKKPTISFRATKVIENILKPDFRCVEFGSGMSTIWLAKRCGFLLSRENNQFWYEKVKKLLEEYPQSKIQYEFCNETLFSSLAEFDDKFFDFALIDGWDRTGCIASVIPKLKEGGWIYLDNTDKDMTVSRGDMRRAEGLLLKFTQENNLKLRYFVDFSPTNLFVEQGLLIQL